MATALLIQADEEKNLETYSLVWLDATVSYAQEFPRIQQRLRSVINDLKIFKQTNECLQYIHSVLKGDQIVLIVSGRFGQEIVPLIHNLQQIISIYVYCMNKQKNDQWASHYPKIKSLVVNLDELVNTIRDYHTARQRNKLNESLKFIAIPILAVDQEQPSKHLYDSFIFSYLLIDDLRRTNSASTDKIDLLSICQRYYAGNEDELKILEEFDQDYTPSRALWWYTRQSFLYRILNKALRDQNLDLLLLFRFYLHDIERQLEKMKYSNTIHVYSGQLILTQKLERFKKTVGGFILTNAFLSANSKHQVESYLADMNCSDEYQRVLFEIEADPRLENIKPFSNITAQNYFPNEEQILFMPGTIFRFKSIQIDENQLWIIQLVLCSENDHHLRTLFYQEDNSDPKTSFGHVCCRFRGFPEAEKYYLHMVKVYQAIMQMLLSIITHLEI
ncbi:hypothetical protein I4U23_019490 [Adineta vaga]|nr:hypothetical protein I4U23_019490 [Adineta vaga]